jgi:hypothetical protein
LRGDHLGVALGQGRALFADLATPKHLRLASAKHLRVARSHMSMYAPEPRVTIGACDDRAGGAEPAC